MAFPSPALRNCSRSPQDVPTRWFAANFMEQRHPLVAAMRAQVSGAGRKWDHGICRSTRSVLVVWRGVVAWRGRQAAQ